jgi:alkylated DNA repair dioxygenase AlkB
LLSILSQEARVSEQFSLFADENAGPEGLRHADHFVSPALEQSLIREIAVLPLTPFQFGQYEGKRRVASFGFSYDYTLRCLTEAEPIPRWLSDVVPKVEAFGGPGTRIQQVLCTEYDVGVGIGWHRDKPHFDRIFGLSLGSTCKLRFRRQAYTKWVRYTREALPRSIYEMSGPSRTVWEHSIPEVEAKRYSITFRTLLAGSGGIDSLAPRVRCRRSMTTFWDGRFEQSCPGGWDAMDAPNFLYGARGGPSAPSVATAPGLKRPFIEISPERITPHPRWQSRRLFLGSTA